MNHAPLAACQQNTHLFRFQRIARRAFAEWLASQPRHLNLENWAKALETGLVGSSTEIAAKVGLTSGRVRQIVRLSKIQS